MQLVVGVALVPEAILEKLEPMLLKWSQCKHSKKGTVRRDWNDVDNHQDCKRIGQTKTDPSLSDPAGQQCIFLGDSPQMQADWTDQN